MPIISIIVPVYNTEMYLRRCIDSILAQSFTDFECILVDDGSTDNSALICQEYANSDSRVKYHCQDNAGPAAARYHGVNKAESTIVMFVDSDDWIENNAIEVFYMKYKETEADMVISTAWNYYIDGILNVTRSKAIDTKQSPLVYYLTTIGNAGSWNKLMNKKLWENLFIPERVPYEDYVTGIQIFNKITINKIVFIDIPIYNYHVHKSETGVSHISSDAYCKPLKEIKHFRVFEWIEKYLSSLHIENRSSIDAAYSWFFMGCIAYPYLTTSKYVTKNETRMFWKHYKKSVTIGKYIWFRKLYIIIFCHFFLLGKLLQFVYRSIK